MHENKAGNSFLIGDTDFGIGEVTFAIDTEKQMIDDLVINGDQSVYDQLNEDAEWQWNWTLYPPKLYFRQIPYDRDGETIHISVNEDTLDDYDVALYLMEHNDFIGTVTICQNKINIQGEVFISGESMRLHILASISGG